MLRLLLLLLGLVGICLPATAQDAGAPLDLSQFRLTFNDSFRTLSISSWGPGTVWIAHTPWAQDFGLARFEDPRPWGPFTRTATGLAITANKDSAGHWHSGLICSVSAHAKSGFAQKYGYFEMKAKLPDGLGVWPAFWLLGTDRKNGVAEFDVMEYYGQRFPAFMSTAHFWSTKNGYGKMKAIAVPQGLLSSQFNTFGVWITPQLVRVYFNRHLAWSFPTPPQFNTPMYMLADLALGGGWPIKQLQSPQVMDIQYIRAYEMK